MRVKKSWLHFDDFVSFPANYALKIREGGRNGTKTTSPTWNSGIQNVARRFIQWKSRRMSIDREQASNFMRFFPQTFGFAPWMRATSSRLYSKACRREKWPVDTPLFSPRDEIFARCLSRDFHPLFEICFLVFFFPLLFEVKLLGNWKMRDVEIFAGKLCIVSLQ